MADVRNPNDQATASNEAALETIRDYLETVRFGSIALTIHDGRIVQLEMTEKRRLAT